ncbi:hypothetical protein EST38_g9407 [Candolleomyces aberdarensis]|uniref:Uncharacterized protein n=1 Tax=Candolleomyces aberdarensis TaxID=2316362 RepID=A0A4Q2DCB8_9AGAR|nr:hypothetical protein EST38_g9407 [Candolleomyces aberdarensis]
MVFPDDDRKVDGYGSPGCADKAEDVWTGQDIAAMVIMMLAHTVEFWWSRYGHVGSEDFALDLQWDALNRMLENTDYISCDYISPQFGGHSHCPVQLKTI